MLRFFLPPTAAPSVSSPEDDKDCDDALELNNCAKKDRPDGRLLHRQENKQAVRYTKETAKKNSGHNTEKIN